ncbi:UDP-N-acetylmuramoyl-L-alanyl-D-glutamate--2,6-diaminopimelate ligase [Desulfobaculum xiamenense]|uniref:UDP-N-acetylmuramoyl-L-alanyl-D-glutamate--2,6-diaminopimelate ligase n=1 Tax=Desulfobaculum xiamenense TaxID=995050 RepID=A0A846QHT3_9BACT|nr:UDP-N-acetylmuramoyl-L-alanyl-D-glutamate--2,6-diaminopimelate ligase [Desulfobaculum xiamenense]NJB67761.1 UDP-N-acetylmuramoyl-L-alanyl-D-glutamate--2,6-diaminopimelate ligase [Desulfobaculum xiamenense]
MNSTFNELVSAVAAGLMVRSDSRRVRSGEVFVAVPGVGVDGAAFISDALERGAAWVVGLPGTRLPEGANARLVEHENPRVALGELAAAYFKTAEHGQKLVGVTGTNGKTTITYLMEHVLTAAGRKVGVIGTVNYRWPGFVLDASMTTPDCWQLHEIMANMAAAGVDTVVMEVSSHALDQDRVAGLAFDVAVLTNVTQDHLDYHKTMDAYFNAKARLFCDLPRRNKAGIVNVDDAYGRILLERCPQCTGYGLYYPATGGNGGLWGDIVSSSSRGLHLAMKYGDQRWELRSSLIGKHNASNLLAAQGAALALGVKPKELKSLEDFHGVPGRLERIPNAGGLDVFVDYAHTPDALENVLSCVGELDFRRLFVVFGCGGNRDRTKRPLMGEAVARYADVAILTSDNPRNEEPLAIMADVRPGLARCAHVIEDSDRRTAIAAALAEMRKGDVLVIAGKGHETYQEIRGERHPFSDAEVVREILG